MSMRSSRVNRPCFALFTITATVTSSYSFEALAMMSRCPLVTGSKEPGQTALCTREPPQPGANVSERRGLVPAVVQSRVAVLSIMQRPIAERPRPEPASRPLDHDDRAVARHAALRKRRQHP